MCTVKPGKHVSLRVCTFFVSLAAAGTDDVLWPRDVAASLATAYSLSAGVVSECESTVFYMLGWQLGLTACYFLETGRSRCEAVRTCMQFANYSLVSSLRRSRAENRTARPHARPKTNRRWL